MNPLIITGFGTSINVDKRKLIITNRLKDTRLEFYPHKINHDGIEDKFNIHKFTSHGLAHLLDVDKEKWWNDILAMEYFPETKQEILDKYENKMQYPR